MSSHGFRQEFVRHVPEYEITATLYVHERTGAQLLSVVADDPNKVFGVTLRTPPHDSTGLPHILEHSVLCGSAKYPVKEPFVELLKGSLKTFLNAFTYPDKTCYPVASTNLADFYNLVDVYLDAVFNQRLEEWIFRQEGWRFDCGGGTLDPENLTLCGVVYNEMKGVYSSPDSILAEFSQRGLFPETPYGLDSGGDPQTIPKLTYEQFVDFHRRYYHPSNARFYFYGNDPVEKRLEIIGALLADFEPRAVDSHVPLQPRIDKPYCIEKAYPAGEGPSKGYVTVNWLLSEVTDVEKALALTILEHALIGLPSSPLRKRLVESGLGEDLAGFGLETELRQMIFSIGLKGVDPERAGEVEPLVLDTMRELARTGLPEGAVEAAVNRLTFSLRENNTGSFPQGLSIMLRCLTTWLHDADLLEALYFEKPLSDLVKRLGQGERILEGLLTTEILDNQHRLCVRLLPDPFLGARQTEQEAELAKSVYDSMSAEERERVHEAGLELLRVQDVADTPEALATIPRLTLADLSPKGFEYESQDHEEAGIRFLSRGLHTHGLVYVDLGFDLAGLPLPSLPVAALFGRAMLEVGAGPYDDVELSERIARVSGGLTEDTFCQSVLGTNGKEAETQLFFRAKCTAARLPELCELLTTILTKPRLDEPARYERLFNEARSRIESALVPSGHAYVNARLRAGLSRAGLAYEYLGGLSKLFVLRRLTSDFQANWPKLREELEFLRDGLLSRGRMLVNITADAENVADAIHCLRDAASELPLRLVTPQEWRIPNLAPVEGFGLPCQVNFCGKGVQLADLGLTQHGSLSAAFRLLRMDYLWDRVRVRGGAYGGFAFYDFYSMSLCQLSYRDPNLQKTLDVFDKAGDFLAFEDFHEDEIHKAIIGAIGEIDDHLLPDAKGFTAMARKLGNLTPEFRQKLREELLGTTRKDIRRVGEALKGFAAKARTVVLGSASDLARMEDFTVRNL